MNELNPTYLAGVFDSDGSFTIARRHMKRSNINYTGMIQLTWKSGPETIMFMELLTSQYGGSYAECSSTNTDKSFSGTKKYLKFSATGVAAEKICRAILPHLLLKKEQAKNILKLRMLTNSFTGPRPPEVSALLEDLSITNKSLNEGSYV